jgi:hypothetical protein
VDDGKSGEEKQQISSFTGSSGSLLVADSNRGRRGPGQWLIGFCHPEPVEWVDNRHFLSGSVFRFGTLNFLIVTFSLERKSNQKVMRESVVVFNGAYEIASLSSRKTRSLRAFFRARARQKPIVISVL